MDIPKDVTAAVCEFTPKQPEPIRTVTTYNEEQVHWAADLINAAQRPLVYFGGGVRSAASCQPLRDLLHKAEIPATYTLMDLVIAVGTRFSDRVALNPKTFAKNATIIQIDIDASELGKNVDVDLSIVGDAAYVLNAMLPQIKPAKHPEWMKMIQSWQAPDVGGAVPAPHQEPWLYHQRRPWHHGLWLRCRHWCPDGTGTPAACGDVYR